MLSTAMTASSPHFTYFNSSGHGYNSMDVTPHAVTCKMKGVDAIKQPTARLSTLKVFRVSRHQVLIQDVTQVAAP